MAKPEQKINPQFPDDESLQSWARNQLWVIKNTPIASNDTVPLPAARIGYALQRLDELLEEKVKHNPAPVEFENREIGKPSPKAKVGVKASPKMKGREDLKKYGAGPAMASLATVKKENKNKAKKVVAPQLTKATQSKAKIVLTAVEKKTLAAIDKLMDAGTVPTYRGIAAELGVKGHAGVHETVNRLAEYGKVILVGKAGRQKIGLPQ